MLWDLRQQGALGTISGVKISGDGIDYSEKYQQIIVGNYRGKAQLQVFDFRQKGLLWQQSNYSSHGIFCVRANKKNEFLTTSNTVNGFLASENGEINKQFLVKNIEKYIFTCDWNNQGKEFAFAGNDGRIRLISVETKK